MTAAELLEVLSRMAKDKVKGSQGVIIMVVQDSERGADANAAVVNIESDQVGKCLEALLKRVGKGTPNGMIIVPG